MRILGAGIFLSLLAGKLNHFKQMSSNKKNMNIQITQGCKIIFNKICACIFVSFFARKFELFEQRLQLIKWFYVASTFALNIKIWFKLLDLSEKET